MWRNGPNITRYCESYLSARVLTYMKGDMGKMGEEAEGIVLYHEKSRVDIVFTLKAYHIGLGSIDFRK